MCEAILKVYDEGLVRPLSPTIYQLPEKADGIREEEEENIEAREVKAEIGEEAAAVVELLEGGLDEEEEDDDDDDEEVEVLDVGEVTEDEVEEPSIASATSATSETSVNPEPDPDDP